MDSIAADPLPVEVIVADNGSHSVLKSEILARHPAVRWLPMNGNVGFGAACNAAVRVACSGKLLFLNPDTELFSGLLEDVCATLDAPGTREAIAGYAIVNNDGTLQLSCRRFPTWKAVLGHRYSVLTKWTPNNPLSRSYLMTDFSHTMQAKVDWVSGAAMAMRRPVFEALGGFDTSYFLYCEDIDICKRALQLGIQTWFCPQVVFRHSIGGSSRNNSVFALYERHRSIWRYYKRHLRVPVFDFAVAIFLFTRYMLLSSTAILHGMKGSEAIHE